MSSTDRPLVEVKNLKQYFNVGRKQQLKAVDDISFAIRRGETFGLVGESGCGKTTCGRCILRVYDATGGQILFDSKEVNKLSGHELQDFRRRAQMIFQDPYASLDPRMTVDDIISEGLNVHYKNLSNKEKHDLVSELLMSVGLNSEHGARFPHELSGGQRQRIGIARALALKPDFIVCDEPISALDVSIQAQIVNLLIKLQRERNLTYLFISHDLSMVKHISDRIGVMYLGKLVEVCENQRLYEQPLHPYTQALISAIPVPDPDKKGLVGQIKLKGEVPSPINTPPGCKFAGRCPYATERCRQTAPELREVEIDHYVACYLYEEGEGLPKGNKLQ
ncbi:MAG: ATP-binding cassette domain-containing protein [Clostridiales bacterium]|nr:ATP-binding cassette domain-containing protein [Clostridiales bacterium]MDD7431995.1 ATP-binding cassette domain-containing protein [Clostridiales bacterium]MDY3060980.1 oligopeptide/dipeptide ABC transporter ATP-binding protein [Eubacteriales bacterium]